MGCLLSIEEYESYNEHKKLHKKLHKQLDKQLSAYYTYDIVNISTNSSVKLYRENLKRVDDYL